MKDSEICKAIKDKYVPLLRKLCPMLKRRNDQTKQYERLFYVYSVFIEPNDKDKVEVFNASRDMLEALYRKYSEKKVKGGNAENNSSKRSSRNSSKRIKAEPNDVSENAADGQLAITAGDSNSHQNSTEVESDTAPVENVSVGDTAVSNEVSVSNSTNERAASEINVPIQSMNSDSVEPTDIDAVETIDLVEPTNENSEPSGASDSQADIPTPQPASTPSPQPASTPSPQVEAPTPQPASTPSPQVEAPTPQPAAGVPSPEVAQLAVQPQQKVNLVKPMVKQNNELEYICASCQFKTTEEEEFMKHSRTDHRTDLSMWCKGCGKCFSNAGVLVAHIKDRNCVREEMHYKCGVKECSFETHSGQTFVHHLRHCHKGSPFIYCIHCEKIFTLPHCLILHMQNDCPFKFRNRANGNSGNSQPPTPSAAQSNTAIAPKPPTVNVAPIFVRQTAVNQPVVANRLVSNVSAVQSTLRPAVQSTLRPAVPVQANPGSAPSISNVRSVIVPGRGSFRGRPPRGRARRRVVVSDSDSEDADDPSWQPDEGVNEQPVRRSARHAKKVFDSREPDMSDSDSSNERHKKSEQPSKTFYNCPCCGFSATFKSLLEDHYMTHHKHPKRNSCSVCSVKFETKQYFLDHFSIHEQEKVAGPSTSVAEMDTTPLPVEDLSSDDTTNSSSVPSSNTTEIASVPAASSPAESAFVPYQNTSTTKRAESVKSTSDVERMKTKVKLQHFFKCMVQYCTYTTDDEVFFNSHLSGSHSGLKPNCVYCLETFNEKELAEHMLRSHAQRRFQCSSCFYRGSKKAHVETHIKKYHVGESAEPFECLINFRQVPELKSEKEMKTIWLYMCGVSTCNFKTKWSKSFKQHFQSVHASLTTFVCYYCKEDVPAFEQLLSHYTTHGINNFQCDFCIYGSETSQEILLHLSDCHPDKHIKVHKRNAEENSTNNDSFSNFPEETNSGNLVMTLSKDVTFSFPIEMPNLGKDYVFCRLGRCTKCFQDVNSYLHHLSSTHNCTNYLCPYCSYICSKVAEFDNHLFCHGPNLFACGKENCTYHSHDEDSVQTHMSDMKHGENEVVKVMRKSTITPLSAILDEEHLPMKKTDVQLVCPFCYYTCNNEKLMKNHLYSEISYLRFDCSICKTTLISRKEAKEHFASEHSLHNIKCAIKTNVEAEHYVRYFLKSDVQKKVFTWISDEMINSTDSSGFPSSKCKICTIHLPTFRELNYHMSQCPTLDYQKFLCSHCGAKIYNMLEMSIHTGKLHPDKGILYSNVNNTNLREGIRARKIADARLSYLKQIVESGQDSPVLVPTKNTAKQYKCTYCNFKDSFRSNAIKHCYGVHPEEDLSVEKVTNHDTKSTAGAVTSENSSSSDIPCNTEIPSKDYYVCITCSKKTEELDELKEHIVKTHETPLEMFSYHYFPDPARELSEDDVDMYDCAYCSASQENLFDLKRHCDHLHHEAEFKVKGQRALDGKVFDCDECKGRFASEELLSNHHRFAHGNKAKKRKHESPKSASSPKRIKITITVFECSYCLEDFKSLPSYQAHARKKHPREFLAYKILEKDATSKEKRFECDICAFTNVAKNFKHHMREQHRNAIRCDLCKMCFENPKAFQMHATITHKGLTVTHHDVCSANSDSEDSDMDTGLSKSPAKMVKEFNFSKITVNFKNKNDVPTRLPLSTLVDMFKLFPVVKVKDTRLNE